MPHDIGATLAGLQLDLGVENKNGRIEDILEQLTAPQKTNLSSRELKHLLEKDFLSVSSTFNTEWLDRFQQRWNPPVVHRDVFELAPPQTRTVVRFTREGLEGRVTGYHEVTVPSSSATAKNSLSLLRKPAAKVDFVRGAAGYFPFAPGGLDGLDSASSLDITSGVRGQGGVNNLDRVIDFNGQEGGLLQVPPGLSRGLAVQSARRDGSDPVAIQIEDALQEVPENMDLGQHADSAKFEGSADHVYSDRDTDGPEDGDIDLLLPVEFSALMPHRPLNTAASRKGRAWAHMVDINRDIPNFRELVPDMAREWPFELDTFQKEAVYHLENGDSVFVAAHTSAGKTVVAEYAIALAAKHMTKAIYTSPIKALSNQKFRDFKETFDDVGILTGDVQINPEASCLIMTTEILRSMLYRGADLIRDVEYVIFDEVHYVNDMERGVVWEEVIIMLPEHVTLILLSATVPNTFEFASWVGRTKRKDIFVISTPKRPVPLEHYLWANKETFKIVDSGKKFLEPGWKAANDALSGRDKIKEQEDKMKALQSTSSRGARGSQQSGPARGGQQARGNQRARGSAQQGRGNIARTGRGTGRSTAAQDRQIWVHLVHYLRKEELLPACIFVFSKRRCDDNADSLANVDFCTATEKSAIHMTVDRSVARLRPEDRNLPQIRRMRELLSRGVAVHHGGLLPIVKEIVEILFAKTLVKVLFATETFAMGLNLPTRTVVFSGFRKHDGRGFRDLLPGEYTQMSGRAGRRGLDTVGNVIIVTQNADEAPPAGVLKQMILGVPTKLRSQFRLTYNMILNLLRVEALKIEEMIKRSFSENATQALLPEHEKQVKVSESDLAKIKREPCEICDVDLDRCHDAATALKALTADLHLQAIGSPMGRRQFSARRLIVFEERGVRKPGIIINDGISTGIEPSVEVLSIATNTESRQNSDILPYTPQLRGAFKPLPGSRGAMEWKVTRVPITSIECVTQTTVKSKGQLWHVKLGKDVEDLDSSLEGLCDSWLNKCWDELDWLGKVKEVSLRDLLEQRKNKLAIIDSCECLNCPNLLKHFGMCHDEWLIKENISTLRQMMSDQNLALLPDYEQRIEVLKDLNFIDESTRVELKGKVACEIHSADELVLTELILENVLADFEPEEIVALLSSFVFQEKTDNEPTLTSRLEMGRDEIIRISEKVNHFQIEHQVILSSNDSNDFVSKPRFGMVEVVYEWARGMSFSRICDLTGGTVPEGTIVRVITRLDETCRECKNAARIIGDPLLFQKMQTAQELIKRDITAVASLYM